MGDHMGRLMILALLVAFTATGCSGTLKTHPATAGELASGYEGVLFYPVRVMETRTKTTTRVENGRVTGTETGIGDAHCEPIVSSKLSVDADFSRPMIVNYNHGTLESFTFAVTLSDGKLVSINTVSTPDQGKTLASLATGAQGILTAAGGGKPEEKPKGLAPCTDGSALLSYRPYPQ